MLIQWIEIRHVSGLPVNLRSTREKFKMECGPEMKGVKSRLVNNIYNRAFLATHLFCFSMNQLYKSTLLKFCSQKNILFLITQLVM